METDSQRIDVDRMLQDLRSELPLQEYFRNQEYQTPENGKRALVMYWLHYIIMEVPVPTP